MLVAGVALAVQVLRSGPAVVTGVMPGSFTGYAFDTCDAPSQQQMAAWREYSPYGAVGIYIAGENRACAEQPNLDAAWVANQAARGWRLLPLSVGPQAPCSDSHRWSKIDPSPVHGFAAAHAQGRAEATKAAVAARDLGIAPRSTLWLDLEAFDVSRARCREATLAYVSSWTQGLRDSGYASGMYSSAASGIRMLDRARTEAPGKYHLPRQIWVGDWNLRHDTASAHLSQDGWVRGRVHQYAGPHDETYGGVTLQIDSSYMEVGGGTVAASAGGSCPSLRTYPVLRDGDHTRPVAVLQCLLQRGDFRRLEPTGEYTSATAQAVRAFQRSRSLPATGVTDRHTWTALLSAGSRPLLKYGSGVEAVRRLQEALEVGGGGRIPVTGVFGDGTQAAVRRYQRAHDLTTTGVVTADLWRLLQDGT